MADDQKTEISFDEQKARALTIIIVRMYLASPSTNQKMLDLLETTQQILHVEDIDSLNKITIKV